MDGPYCYGCGRTLEEISGWGAIPPDEKSGVWAALPQRLISMGIRTFRLAPEPAQIGSFMARTFRETTGVWGFSGPSLSTGYVVNDATRPDVTETTHELIAVGPEGQLRLTKHDRVRAFGIARGRDATDMNAVALVLPKARARRENPETNTASPDHSSYDLALPDHYLSAAIAAGPGAERVVGRTWADTRYTVLDFVSPEAPITVTSALGAATVKRVAVAASDKPADLNAPVDIKMASAFAVCAMFQADDPEWLRHALAPQA